MGLKRAARWVLVSLVWLPLVVNAMSVQDDLGNTVSLAKPAQRVLSLAPDLTEIVFAIGAQATLCGVMSGSDYPAAANQLPKVGAYTGLDMEQILAAQPQLILNWDNNFLRQVAWLKASGIPVYSTRPKALEDVARTMENIGQLVGQPERAHQAASAYRLKLRQLRQRYQAAAPIRVFYQIGDSLLTINQSSWINQAIQVCGGRNVFAKVRLSVPEISLEAVLTANPDVILSSNTQSNWQQRWQNWPSLTAVKYHTLYTINPDWLERAGPRLVLGVEQICQVLQLARLKLQSAKN